MSLRLRCAALAVGFVVISAASPTLAAKDAFADACAARGKSTPAHCACQAKLARSTLNAKEQAAMIRAMKGDTEGFRAAVAAMGAAPAQGFVAKMKTLQGRAEAECR